MAYKIYDKKDLEFQHGYITDKDGVLLNMDRNVVRELNALDRTKQYIDWLEANPVEEGKEPEPFDLKSDLFENVSEYFEDLPDTPVRDARAKEALAFMEECDAVHDTDKVNHVIQKYEDVILWCKHDHVVTKEMECRMGHDDMIDTPALGDPLELKPEDVVDIIKQASKIGCNGTMLLDLDGDCDGGRVFPRLFDQFSLQACPTEE